MHSVSAVRFKGCVCVLGCDSRDKLPEEVMFSSLETKRANKDRHVYGALRFGLRDDLPTFNFKSCYYIPAMLYRDIFNLHPTSTAASVKRVDDELDSQVAHRRLLCPVDDKRPGSSGNFHQR